MHFLKTITLICLIAVFHEALAQNDADFYQLKIYYIQNEAQERILDEYLELAYLPAMHKAGIKDVGVFKKMRDNKDTARAIYVLVPFSDAAEVFEIDQKLNKNEDYLRKGERYVNASYNQPPYQRMEVILLSAFELHPNYQKPPLTAPKEERIYELRSYESATERIFQNKVKMFNEGGEIDLFKKLGFNAVFYGEVVAGCHMPNLMYMTTFDSKESRDRHWEAFGKDPFWKKLSSDPEYQNNVSHIDITFLRPTEYSDL